MFSILFNVVRHQRRKWLFRFSLTNEPDVFEKTIPANAPSTRDDEITDPEILAALRKLPQSYAEAVILADVQEFSYKEISDAIGCPIGTVMSRISRGRELLRKALTSVAAERGMLRPKAPLAQRAIVV